MASNLRRLARRANNSDLAEVRVAFMECCPTQAQLSQGAGAKGGEQHIRLGQSFMQGRLPSRCFQVSTAHTHALV